MRTLLTRWLGGPFGLVLLGIGSALTLLGLVAWQAPTALPRPAGVTGCNVLWMPKQDRRECYLTEMAAQLDERGVEAVAEFDRLANELKSLSAHCHGYMHQVAPAWVRRNVTFENLAEMVPPVREANCGAGYLHVVFSELSQTATSVDQLAALAGLCTAQTGRLQQLNCNHGLGHAASRHTAVDLNRATAVCDTLGSSFVEECAAGLFHEYWLVADGLVPSVTPPQMPENEVDLCEDVRPTYLEACYVRALEHRYTAEIVELRKSGKDPDGAVDQQTFDSVCGSLAASHIAPCVTGVAWNLQRSADVATEDLIRVCGDMPLPETRACFLGFAPPLEQEARVEELKACDATAGASRIACFEARSRLYSVMVDGRPELALDCSALREGAVVSACQRGVARVNDPYPTIF